MATFSDTTVSISLATPDDVRELSQRSLNIWAGAMSPLWAPFFMAASFGVGVWSLGQGMARSLGGTLYDRDLPLAAKWPGFLPAPASDAVKTVEAATETVAETTLAPLTEIVEATADTASDLSSETLQQAAETVDVLRDEAAEKADTKPLIDPVTEMPVIPGVIEAIAEPKLLTPKKPRKS